jgi:hypothetical protein
VKPENVENIFQNAKEEIKLDNPENQLKIMQVNSVLIQMKQ